jgi:hypothetical protein
MLSNRVCGTSKHPRHVRNWHCRLWWDVHHTRPSPWGVPLDVRLPHRVVVGSDLLDQILQRGIPTVHDGCNLSTREKVPGTPLHDHLRRIKHICQRLKSLNAELNLKIYENSLMVGARNSVHHRHMPHLVVAELPQHPVDGVLLHVHVEQQRRPRHPVLLVTKAQSREALWSTGRDSLFGVRRHLTSASVKASNRPTKSLYAVFVWSWAYKVCIQTKCEP